MGATCIRPRQRCHCATARQRASIASALSCGFIRSFADPHAEADSLGVFVLLLQPAQSVSQSAERRREPRRGIGAYEHRAFLATSIGNTARGAGDISPLFDATECIVFAA